MKAERDRLAKIVEATLKALPVGYIPNHTADAIPEMVTHWVKEAVRWEEKCGKLRDHLIGATKRHRELRADRERLREQVEAMRAALKKVESGDVDIGECECGDTVEAIVSAMCDVARAALAGSPVADKPNLFPVTDETEDAPDGAIVDGYERVGDEWCKVVPPGSPVATTGEKHHGLDNDRQVFFYERDYYVLSNFSAFRLRWKDHHFDTSEAAYHYEKFPAQTEAAVRAMILTARSAHEAFKIAERFKDRRRPDWDDLKIGVMKRILFEKADQHEYVRRKLLATGDRELIEDSWRDSFWGWGPNRDGQNMLGKLWMEIRAELRAAASEGRTP